VKIALIASGFALIFCMNTLVLAGVSKNTLAILVNENDPESIEIARYYQKARLITQDNVIYLKFRSGGVALSEAEFADVSAQLASKIVKKDIQAFALAWRRPWRVSCMSITSAFSLGFDRAFCSKGCKLTKKTGYFNSQSQQPFEDFALRPSMLLSASSVASVKKLIDRSVSADYQRPIGSAYLLSTSDKHRNVRAAQFPLYAKSLYRLMSVEQVFADALRHKQDVMFYFTGRSSVKYLDENVFLPGSIADHLTSAGGHLFNGNQMSIVEWIDAGASGSYGAVVEPCNYLQKFPNPGIVMQKYLSGETLVEAYWKSVQMPGQGLFVGDPLVAPFKGCKVSANGQGVFQYKKNKVRNFVEKKNRNCGFYNSHLKVKGKN